MTPAITLWLAFVLAVGAIAWFGSRRQAIAFLVLALVTAPATALPLGHAAPWQPAPGQYTVLGARIDIDEAIYVLLDGDPSPRFYRLPYSQSAANQLQAALDGTADGEGSVSMRLGEDGSPGFREEGGAAEEPKRAEQPTLRMAP